MNDMNTTASTSVAAASNDFNVIHMMIVMARHKKLIMGVTLAMAVIATGISLLLPNVYKASTKLLPPQQAQSGAAALLSQLGGAGSAVAGAAGLKNPNDTYVGILKSRTVADKLIAQFNLQKLYDVTTMEKTRTILETNSKISSGKDGLITIEFEDENKQLVARVANAYVAELISMTKVLAVTEASQRRMFFERQLEQSKDNLANAEMALKSALSTSGVISVDGDSRAIVETVGRVRAQISAKEIQLNAMQAFVTTNNQDYKRAQEELNSLRAELSKLENGRPGAPLTAAAGNKQTGLDNIKILRDVKYYQMLYELLAKQYEVARLDEAKDTAIIQVLDPAIEPERKIKPKRAVIVIVTTVLGFLAAVFWAFLTETKKRMLAGPQAVQQWGELKTLVRFK